MFRNDNIDLKIDVIIKSKGKKWENQQQNLGKCPHLGDLCKKTQWKQNKWSKIVWGKWKLCNVTGSKQREKLKNFSI